MTEGDERNMWDRDDAPSMEYAALKQYGFSPQKAAEIILDAKRGMPNAVYWVRAALRETEKK